MHGKFAALVFIAMYDVIANGEEKFSPAKTRYVVAG